MDTKRKRKHAHDQLLFDEVESEMERRAIANSMVEQSHSQEEESSL